MPPIRPLPARCAAVERGNEAGQWGTNCSRPPTVKGVWRFVDVAKPVELCELHAADLADEERLTISG